MQDSKTPHPSAGSNRGMSLSPQKRDGYPVAQLTDSQDRLIASVTLVRGVDPSYVRAVFQQLLETADPVRPKLRLLRDRHSD